uniref:ORF9 protein n=1 Tax=Lucheng Rn rat coronavirus TaxID=1508224 RepID=A0A866W1D1_9ALPC|nr:ORF9 protein [Lucheng Rn rat coronavirus]
MNCLLLLLLSSVLGAPTVTFIRSKTLDEPETYEELLVDYKLQDDIITPDKALDMLSLYSDEHDELKPWDWRSLDEDRIRILALLKCKDLMRSADMFVPGICKRLN